MSITVIITTSDGANSITRSATANLQERLIKEEKKKESQRIRNTIKALADGLEASSKSP